MEVPGLHDDVTGVGVVDEDGAGAIPKREPEVWNCPGGTTMIVTAGRNGWVGDSQYHAVTFSIRGMFTPTGGTAQPVVEDKQWAGGEAGADAITCTMQRR